MSQTELALLKINEWLKLFDADAWLEIRTDGTARVHAGPACSTALSPNTLAHKIDTVMNNIPLTVVL
jgi:hypothetical protein